jgi:hypothetical protein
MVTPTAADIREWSKVDFDELTYADDVDLQRILDQALSYTWYVTGRPADDTLPPEFDGLMRQAILMRTEQVAYQSVADYVETGSDSLIGSFTAGSYSETRHDPTRRGETRSLNPWIDLSNILWMLMTDDKQDYWRFMLQNLNAPAFEVTQVDWAQHFAGTTSFGDPFPPTEPLGHLS